MVVNDTPPAFAAQAVGVPVVAVCQTLLYQSLLWLSMSLCDDYDDADETDGDDDAVERVCLIPRSAEVAITCDRREVDERGNGGAAIDGW